MSEVERLEAELAAARAAAGPANLITAEAAAKILGVSRGAVYDLAAPKGPIPCVRLGRRCIRFNQEDVEAHVRKCLHTLIKITIAGDIRSTKSLTAAVSEPLNCFQRRGLAPKPKLSSKPKTRDSLQLRLVSRKKES